MTNAIEPPASTDVVEPQRILSPIGESLIRWGSVGAVLAVFAAALTLSWTGLIELAVEAGFSRSIAFLFPVVIDGAVVGGSIAIVLAQLTGASKVFPWAVVLFGASVSVWGNAMVGGDSLTAKAVHSLAPLSLALSIHLLTGVVQHRIVVAQEEAREEAERLEKERKKAERAAKRSQALAARRAKGAGSGPTDTAAAVEAMERIAAALPPTTSITDQVVAVLDVFPSPPASDLALALGWSNDDADVRKAHRALERARKKIRRVKEGEETIAGPEAHGLRAIR